MPVKLINGIAAGSDQDVGLRRAGGQRWRAFFGDTLVYGSIPGGDCPRITTDAADPIVISEGQKTTFKVCLDRQPKGVVELTVSFKDNPRNPVELADTPAVPDNAVKVAGIYYLPRSEEEAGLLRLIEQINQANPEDPPTTVEEFWIQRESPNPPPRFVVSEFVSTLVFTPTDYECKTVTLQAIDVPDVTDLYTMLCITGPPGEVVNSITRRVHVRNDDMLTPRLEVNKTSLELGTGGDIDDFGVRLTARPSADVTVAFSELTNATINRESLTFKTFDWGVIRTITVTSGDNVGMETLSLTPSGGGVDVTPATIDIDVVTKTQVAVSPDSLTMLEGETKEVQVRVTNAPDSYSVIVRVDEISPLIYAGPQVLTFTDSRTQTVRVTALRDVLSGDQDGVAQVRFILSGAGDDFTKVLPVRVVNTSTTPLLAVAPTYLPMDSESVADVTVKLTERPSGEVAVSASVPRAVASVSPNRATFDRDNWNTAQEFEVTAVELVAGDDDALGELVFTSSMGGAVDEAIVSIVVTPLTSLENSLIVSASAVSVVAGMTTQVQASLDRAPVTSYSLGQPTYGTVSVAVASSDADVTVSPATLSFDGTNWKTPVAVTIDATSASAMDTATVQLTPSGGNSNGVTRNVAVTVVAAAATVLPTFQRKGRGQTLVPGGPYVRESYVLSSAPAAAIDVQVRAATVSEIMGAGYGYASNPIVLQGDPVTLGFDGSNYSAGLVLAYRAISQVNQPFGFIRYEAANGSLSSDTGLISLPLLVAGGGEEGGEEEVEVVVEISPLFSTSAVSIVEGESAIVGISLSARPQGAITVQVVERSKRLSTSGASLAFTPQNWHIPQNVTLMALITQATAARSFDIYAYASGTNASSEPAVMRVSVTAPAVIRMSTLGLKVTFASSTRPSEDPRYRYRRAYVTWTDPTGDPQHPFRVNLDGGPSNAHFERTQVTGTAYTRDMYSGFAYTVVVSTDPAVGVSDTLTFTVP